MTVGGAILALARILRSARAPDGERGRDLIVVLAHALPYLAAVILYERTYSRFVIPLLPYAAVLSAAFLRDLGRSASARLAVPLARGAAVSLIVALPLGA